MKSLVFIFFFMMAGLAEANQFPDCASTARFQLVVEPKVLTPGQLLTVFQELNQSPNCGFKCLDMHLDFPIVVVDRFLINVAFNGPSSDDPSREPKRDQPIEGDFDDFMKFLKAMNRYKGVSARCL